MKPFSPGRPSEENMATLIQAAEQRRALHQPAEILEAARAAAFLEQADIIKQRRGGDAVIEDLHENAAQGGLNFDGRPSRRARSRRREPSMQ